MRLIKGRSFYKEPWYGSYHSMMDRCYREGAKNYPMYGGRGIEVCEEWHNIEAFEKWANESGFRKGLTLERKDVNGNYSPDNCTWVTMKQQANNRRNTLMLEYKGEIHSASEWADIIGVCRSTITNRYYRGMPIEKILARGDLRCLDTYRERLVEILQTQTGKRKMQISKASTITDALLANDVIILNHGKWLKNPSGFTNAICSICFGESPIDEKEIAIKTKFCPNCGADMRGKDNG